MDIKELITIRRSRRTYTDVPIAEDALRAVIEAGLLAPTGRNLHPAEIIVVRDKAMLAQLSRAKTGGSALIEGADAALVVVCDKTRSDTWVEDGAIMMAYMQLQAEALGIGNCWVQIHLRQSQTVLADGGRMSSDDFVKNALNIPAQYEVLAILALGNSNEERPPHTVEDLDMNKVHREQF